MNGPHRNPLGNALRQRLDEAPPPAPLPEGPISHTWSASSDLYSYITERGFFFPHEVVSRYLLALHSQPFALFSGISGTGKTKLALLTAEYYAHAPGTLARRLEQPEDTETEFYIPIEAVTLRSGTLTPRREQFDYFNIEPGGSATVTITVTNILGAHGDITVRAHNLVYGGRKNISLGLPVSLRRAFDENGITSNDYLKFEIVEEFKRYRVSLFRPAQQEVEELTENRYAFISVRPSWDDHTALLGEYDDELERYFRTPVLELLLRAGREEQEALRQGRVPVPYFVILDEMNIARIEHYFSDFLSALESRRYDADGRITQEPLNLHNADATCLTWIDEQGVEYEIPQRLPIPTNVLFTGTVNDDDTTQVLSPKVLDRANTMEFSAVDFEVFLGLAVQEQLDGPFQLRPEQTRELELGKLELSSQLESQRMRAQLEPLLLMNSILTPVNKHFGYRVLNDCALYMRNARELIGDSPDIAEAACDIQIMQKVLPKLFGAADDRDGVLRSLLHLCATGDLPERVPLIDEILAACIVDATDIAGFNPALLLGESHADELVRARYPRSAGKLVRMLTRIEAS